MRTTWYLACDDQYYFSIGQWWSEKIVEFFLLTTSNRLIDSPMSFCRSRNVSTKVQSYFVCPFLLIFFILVSIWLRHSFHHDSCKKKYVISFSFSRLIKRITTKVICPENEQQNKWRICIDRACSHRRIIIIVVIWDDMWFAFDMCSTIYLFIFPFFLPWHWPCARPSLRIALALFLWCV